MSGFRMTGPRARRAHALAAVSLFVLTAGAAILGVWSVPAIGLRSPAVAYAAPMEDCDLDGYDDHTGSPVPWAGFDGTRGDTVPAGWDGVANSWKGEHTNDGSGGTSSSSSAGNSSGGGVATSGNGGSGSAAKGSGASSKRSSATSKASGSSAPAAGVVTSVVTGGSATKAAAATVGVGAPSADLVAGDASRVAGTAAPSTATIVSTRGALTVADAAGALIHLDAPVRVAGTGFAPTTRLTLFIDSIPLELDSVSTDDKGAFVATAELPRSLEPGVHTIIVRYGGSEVTRTSFAVGPRTADTFLKALSVGFAENNPERGAGLALLAVLGVVGVGSWGHRLTRRS